MLNMVFSISSLSFGDACCRHLQNLHQAPVLCLQDVAAAFRQCISFAYPLWVWLMGVLQALDPAILEQAFNSAVKGTGGKNDTAAAQRFHVFDDSVSVFGVLVPG